MLDNRISVKLAQSLWCSLWVWTEFESRPTNALVKIECAWNSPKLDMDLTANCLVETRTKLEELIPTPGPDCEC